MSIKAMRTAIEKNFPDLNMSEIAITKHKGQILIQSTKYLINSLNDDVKTSIDHIAWQLGRK